MEEFLVILLQGLFEFTVNVLLNLPFDWPSKNRRSPEPMHIGWRCTGWLIGGCAIGAFSLLFLKHSLIHYASLRMLNVAVAPLAAADLSQWIARRRARTNPNIVPRNHYWQAFCFALAFALVRFAYATHG